MALEDRKQWGEVHRDLPSGARSESTPAPLRCSKRGELYTHSIAKGRMALSDEGSYFIATNPTPGTGVAGIAATGAFSALETLIHLRNNSSGDNATRLYMDYIKLQTTVAGTNGTDCLYTINLDSGTSRYTSGGAAVVPVNPNMDSSGTPNSTLYVGALVTAAATSDVRQVANGVLRPVISVVGDEFLFDFGGDVKGGAGSLFEGTLISRQVIPVAPVILGPTDQLVMSFYATSQTAATSFEFEIGYYER